MTPFRRIHLGAEDWFFKNQDENFCPAAAKLFGQLSSANDSLQEPRLEPIPQEKVSL
jgi:hypothetical protein